MRQEQGSREGFTLVLGGGGSPGLAYCCGALEALRSVAGIDVYRAKAMIGTSAGAVVAAHLALGRTVDEMMEMVTVDAAGDSSNPTPSWQSTPDLLRRLVGSAWIMSRSAFPMAVRTPEPPAALQRLFPGSLFHVSDESWTDRFPTEWPDGVLWTVASDLDTGQRVVLRGDGTSPKATLRQAVQASCAVPGVFRPVRVGSRRLVDGGVQSVTNLDLASHTRAAVVIGLAPMGFEPGLPPGSRQAIWRRRFNNQLARESAAVRRSGASLLLLRPTGDDLRHHTFNLLSRSGNEMARRAAYESTSRRVGDPRVARVLEQIVEQSRSSCAS